MLYFKHIHITQTYSCHTPLKAACSMQVQIRGLQTMARGPHPARHIISSGPPNKSLCGGLEKIIIVRMASQNYSKLGLLIGGAQPESVFLSLDSVTHRYQYWQVCVVHYNQSVVYNCILWGWRASGASLLLFQGDKHCTIFFSLYFDNTFILVIQNSNNTIVAKNIACLKQLKW